MLNRSEYIYFLHETRNLLPILGLYNLTSDLSTPLTVHSQMNSREASTSKAVGSYNEVTYFLVFSREVSRGTA